MLQWPVHIALSMLILSVDLVQDILSIVDTLQAIEWRARYLYYKHTTTNMIHRHCHKVTAM